MSRLGRIVEWVALLGPLAAILHVVLRYGVNFPFADQWDFVAFFVVQETGELRWSDIWALHNEHRMVAPKLAMLGLAWLTRWNIVTEMLVSVSLALASLFTLRALARPILDEAGQAIRIWIALTLSLHVFSLSQGTNWLWGWQIQWFLSLFAAILSIALATWSLQAQRPWVNVTGSAAAALVCQYSIASGLVAWGASALVLAFHPLRRRILPLWLALFAIASTVYFIGYVRHGGLPSLLVALDRPLALLEYVGNYLSGPLGRHAAVGIFVAIAFVVLALIAARHQWRKPELFMPWVALGAFAGSNALLTGIGRLGMGAEQGLASRYATIALLMSVALVPLGILAFHAWPAGRRSPLKLAAAVAGAALLTLPAIVVDGRSMTELKDFSRQIIAGRKCVTGIEAETDACLVHLHPDPSVVRLRAPQLKALGLSSFAPTSR